VSEKPVGPQGDLDELGLEPECGYCGVRPAVVNLLLFAQPAAARPTVRVELARAVHAALHPASRGTGHAAVRAAGRPSPPHPAVADGGREVQR
jgi:hypothetical protein